MKIEDDDDDDDDEDDDVNLQAENNVEDGHEWDVLPAVPIMSTQMDDIMSSIVGHS